MTKTRLKAFSDGSIMWANLHLLFWLSLAPFGRVDGREPADDHQRKAREARGANAFVQISQRALRALR